ncbi:MAG: DUF4434 domain-containing protein [Giesbergeria sp.]
MFTQDTPNTALETAHTRRAWLTMAAATLLAGCAGGGSSSEKYQATFLQPWQAYENLSLEEWQRRLKITRDLGCNEIILQWSALYGGSYPWTMPESLIQLIFDEGAKLGIGIRVGLPYNEGWWNALRGNQTRRLESFLTDTQANCIDTMESSRWPAQAGFQGWYLPYELDQYNWATPQRRELLMPWLSAIAATASKRSAQPLALSTFYSSLDTTGTLAGLWSEILDQVTLRPMLQDGVGVAGLKNYEGLDPLRTLLHDRGVPFDLIVELFEQLPALPNTNNAFRAKAASSSRISAQMEIARSYGADRIVAFAIDPWLLSRADEELTLPYSWGSYT